MTDVTKLTDSQLETIISSTPLNGTPAQLQTWTQAWREREIRKRLEKRMKELQRRGQRDQWNKDFSNEVEGRLAMMGH